MIKLVAGTAFCALLSCGLASPGIAAERGGVAGATAAAERLLGSDREEAQARECLPFTRQFGVSGIVSGSLATSTALAGVPAAAMLEALRALGTAIDLKRDLQDGDGFHVRFEQAFTVEGQAIGIGRVLWAELQSAAKGTVEIHRFPAQDGVQRFWLASGLAATPPSIRLPLDVVSVSSGFGLRADPFGQPSGRAAGGTTATDPSSLGMLLSARTIEMIWADITKPAPGLSPRGSSRSSRRVARALIPHNGVDFVTSYGTPVYAASDGVVLGAGPNGGYGNWIQIDHLQNDDRGKLSTVYGHLSRFAPGLKSGVRVSQGDVIGFVGSTGHSTGPHLHFEILSNGKPVDPMIHPEVLRAQLSGADLARFDKQVTADLAERDLSIVPSSWGF